MDIELVRLQWFDIVEILGGSVRPVGRMYLVCDVGLGGSSRGGEGNDSKQH